MISGGVDHLVICGTTGESPTFNDDEFQLLLETAVQTANGRASVVAGSGANDTRKSIKRSKIAKEAGCDGLLLVCPYYNKPNQQALIRHFTNVADEIHLPVMLYNVPGRTSVNMLPETTAELAQHEYIVAVKEASNDMQQILKVMELVPDSFEVIAGDDAMAMPVMLCGGDGVVSVAANEIPEQMKSYVEACASENLQEARSWHYKLQGLFNANFLDSNPAPSKAALSLMGYMENTLRPPLYPVSNVVQDAVEKQLKRLGVL